MLATDIVTLLKDFDGYCDTLVQEKEVAVIGRHDKGNVVLMPLDEYNKMLKKLFELKNIESKA